MSIFLLAQDRANRDVAGVGEDVEGGQEAEVNQEGIGSECGLDLGKHCFVFLFPDKSILLLLRQGKYRG